MCKLLSNNDSTIKQIVNKRPVADSCGYSFAAIRFN